jgi:ribonuclease BN (tRNA processing enzyme)
MALTVTVLGSAGTYAQADNPCSGYLLRSESTTVWLDCGPGTLGALQQHVALGDVDAVVVSHQHPDHWLELPVVRNAWRYGLGRTGLPVLATAGVLDLAATVLDADLAPTFDATVIADGSVERVGDLSFRFSRTDHPVETMACRVTDGTRTFAYSADTGPAWSFAALDPDGEGFDLALCEATLDADQAGSVQHLTGRQAGAMARAAGVRRLAIAHLLADTESRRELEAAAPDAFDGPVEVASPGTTFTV